MCAWGSARTSAISFATAGTLVQAMLTYAERVHDIHIKNVTEATKKGRGIEMPRGKIDMPAFVRALRKVKYSGVCSLSMRRT